MLDERLAKPYFRQQNVGEKDRLTMDFSGKTIVVTGGTSGIGAATALAFADAGGRVLISGRNAKGAAKVMADAKRLSGRIDFVQGDLSDRATCDRLIAEAVKRLGRIDVLINNAGIGSRVSSLETTDETWRSVMTVNVDAVFYLSRAAALLMKERRSGTIVNNASELGLIAEPGKFSYCVSKAAVVQITRCMALDLAPFNIRVNAVAPGDTRTAMMERKIRDKGLPIERGVELIALRTPLKRVAMPLEIAKVMMFLASDDASFMTGNVVAVDGGTTVTGPPDTDLAKYAKRSRGRKAAGASAR